MDLSFSRFEHDASVAILPPDLAVMMVGIAARQAASPTALFHSRLPATTVAAANLFAPLHGAFNAAMAAALVRWREI
ncbi:MAG: hypothetical protein V4564_23655 [Pseudomonadota bacterium]|uniref:hypothetical protein n=1 Tax=Sphingomonas sp. ERG5 TaxID=1381597 RepID=UPI00054B5A88|nr:hypothetical protein [Sphingomonas sp. ERG5]